MGLCGHLYLQAWGRISADHMGRVDGISAFPASSCGNASQGAFWQDNSLCRFFKWVPEVPDMEELCEGPAALGTPSLSPPLICWESLPYPV